jgi:ankyrin repeat protein
MSFHGSAIELFLKLGYTKTKGLCHGLAIRWLEACILGEEDLYDARIKRINKLVSSKVDIVQLVNALKAKKGRDLTKKDKELLDLLAFFDSLELYHLPGEHSALFNRSHESTSIDIISQADFASSDKIRAKGGLAQIYSEPMIPTTAEIAKYLEDLGKVLQKDGVAKDTFGVVLTSINHTIALNYKPDVGWGFMDINQYPAQFFKLDKSEVIKIIAEKIVAGFDFNKKGGPIAFNASVITTKDSASILKLTKKLKQFKETHRVTKEIASREQEGVSLALIAAQQGHPSVIAKLGKHKADLNVTDKEGSTPAYFAAARGRNSVIEELAKHKADLNKEDKEGFTPAHIAAQVGHVAVIAELAKHKADLNKTADEGCTPAYIAAQQGHASVIAELAKYKIVDLNKATDVGCTPVYIAAAKGHVSVIAELAKHKIVDLNKTTRSGCTPAYVAAAKGHASVIVELAKHKADLNKAAEGGFTPAYIAASKGHVSVLIELIRSGVDIKTPSRMASDVLRKFASSYGASVVSRIEGFITRKLNRGYRSFLMTPYEIAVVMGHKEVIQLLSKQVIQTYFNNKYFKVAPSGENKDKPEPLNDVTRVPKYFDNLKELKLKKVELDLKLKNIELLIDAAKKNEEKVIGRKYFIDFIDEHKSQYAVVLNTVKGSAKEGMIKKEAQQRKSSIASKVQYGASWATALMTTGYRFFTPKAKQEYVESFLPNTIDSQCKADFKKLAKESCEQLKKALTDVNQNMINLNKHYHQEYAELQPFIETISAEDFADLLSVDIDAKVQETTKLYEKSNDRSSHLESKEEKESTIHCRKM